LTSQLIQIFFGLPSNWRENFLEEAFALQMFLKMSHWEAYSLPVTYRKWYLKRLEKYYKDKNVDSKKSTDKPISGEKNLKKYESMLQNKFKNN